MADCEAKASFIIPPYLEARLWRDLGSTAPSKWMWPMIGSRGGLGGWFKAGLDFERRFFRERTRRVEIKQTEAAKA